MRCHQLTVSHTYKRIVKIFSKCLFNEGLTESIDLSGLNLKSLLDRSIWNSFKLGSLTQSILNDDQQSELFELNEFVKEKVKRSTRHLTVNHGFVKTTRGYSLQRKCYSTRSKNCKSKWNLNINMLSGKAQLSCNQMCDHIFGSLPKGL